jgi:hypothetical protein
MDLLRRRGFVGWAGDRRVVSEDVVKSVEAAVAASVVLTCGQSWNVASARCVAVAVCILDREGTVYVGRL